MSKELLTPVLTGEGKTLYALAIGLNIIMAQAGLYVAASSFIFNPYRKIFTRILNNDNIFKYSGTVFAND